MRWVWGDLDKLLIEMRDHEEPMGAEKYDRLTKEMKIIPIVGIQWTTATSMCPTSST